MGLTSFRLDTGRSVDLMHLEVSPTYGGYLEGFPSAELNDRHLQQLHARLTRRYTHMGVHIIPPRRTTPANPSYGHRGEPEEHLPPIQCIGVFESSPVADRSTDDCFGLSTLVIVWFQDVLELPVSEAARAELAAVSWETLARDGSM